MKIDNSMNISNIYTVRSKYTGEMRSDVLAPVGEQIVKYERNERRESSLSLLSFSTRINASNIPHSGNNVETTSKGASSLLKYYEDILKEQAPLIMKMKDGTPEEVEEAKKQYDILAEKQMQAVEAEKRKLSDDISRMYGIEGEITSSSLHTDHSGNNYVIYYFDSKNPNDKNMTIIEYANGERSLFDLAPNFTAEDFEHFKDTAFNELLKQIDIVDTPYEAQALKEIFNDTFLELSKKSFSNRF